jgi:hypothetical protein
MSKTARPRWKLLLILSAAITTFAITPIAIVVAFPLTAGVVIIAVHGLGIAVSGVAITLEIIRQLE